MNKAPSMAKRYFTLGTMLAAAFLVFFVFNQNGFGQNTVDAQTVSRGPYVQNVTPTSVTIMWKGGAGSVNYGETTSYGTTVAGVLTAGVYKAKISGLKPKTKYFYQSPGSTAGDQNFYFKTALPAGDPTSFSFAVWGDSGVGDSYQTQTATQVESKRPDLVFVAGDVVYDYGGSNQDSKHFSIYKNTMRNTPFYDIMGNHDDNNPAEFLADHDFPQNGTAGGVNSTYSFDYGLVHFTILNTQLGDMTFQPSAGGSTGAQMRWAYNDLKNSTQPLKVLIFHHNGWSAGTHNTGDGVPMTNGPLQMAQDPLVGVDMVFWGHSHVYERFDRYPDRAGAPVYFTIGNGGKHSTARNCPGNFVNGPKCFFGSKGESGFLLNSVSVETAGTQSIPTVNTKYITMTGTNPDSATYTAEAVAPVADTTKPTIAITTPTSGAVVGNNQTINVNATDNVGVVQATFYVDGALKYTDFNSPFAFDWSTTQEINGLHTLTARAKDQAGNEETSAPVSVTVNNVLSQDTQLPTVTITNPIAGSTVSGFQPVAVSASDNVGVTRVELVVNGLVVGSDGSEPYVFNWNTTEYSNATHSLIAKAYDAAGNEKIYSLSVTVDNGPAVDQTVPAISSVSSVPTSLSSIIRWVTNENSGSRVEYGQTTSYGATVTVQGDSVQNHVAEITGLIPSTLYHYRVISADVSGNESNSADYTFTTAALGTTGSAAIRIVGLDLSTATAPASIGIKIDERSTIYADSLDVSNLTPGEHTVSFNDLSTHNELMATCSYPENSTECALGNVGSYIRPGIDCFIGLCTVVFNVERDRVTKIAVLYLDANLTVARMNIAKQGTGTGSVEGGPILCGDVCSVLVPAGTLINFRATPSADSTFVGWAGPCTGNGACPVRVGATRTLVARFDLKPLDNKQLTVHKSGTGQGTVTGTSVSCGNTCSADLAGGTSVTLQASASAGSSFAGWQGACIGNAACSLLMDANKDVTAVFNLDTAAQNVTITVNRSGAGAGTVSGGGINCGSTCTQTITLGSSVNLTAQASTGSTFAGWSGACTGTNSCVFTASSNSQVTATFTLTAAAGEEIIFEDFGTSSNWIVIRGGNWALANNGYALTSPLQLDASGNGNIAVYNTEIPNDFVLTTDALVTATSNTSNDFSIIFGFRDLANYYYANFSEAQDELSDGVFRVDQGVRTKVQNFGGGEGVPSTASAILRCDPDDVEDDLEDLEDEIDDLDSDDFIGSNKSERKDRKEQLLDLAERAVDAADEEMLREAALLLEEIMSKINLWIDEDELEDVQEEIDDLLNCEPQEDSTPLSTVAVGSIQAGVTQNIKIDRQGTSLKVYLNNRELAAINITPDISGKIGYGSNNDSAFFSNLLVTSPDSAAVAPRTVTVSRTGSGAGTVTGGGVSCGSTCTTQASLGTQITLTAAPASGSTFAAWGGACSGTDLCTFTLNSNSTVTATFNLSSGQAVPPTLSVQRAGTGTGTVTGGAINCGGTCTAEVNSGTQVTLVATPATGSTFTGWSGACSTTGSCVVTITSAINVIANFGSSGSNTGSGETLRLSFAGDFDMNSDTQANIRNARDNSDLLLILGDLAYTDTAASTWCSAFKAQSGNLPVIVLAGDHDNGTDTGAMMPDLLNCLPPKPTAPLASFEPGGNYPYKYWVDLKASTRLIVTGSIRLNTTIPAQEEAITDWHVGQKNYIWLQNAIRDARAKGIKNILVANHEPCLDVSTKKSTREYASYCQDVFDLLVSEKVDISMAGSSHSYWRTKVINTSATCPRVIIGNPSPSCATEARNGNEYTKAAGLLHIQAGTGGASSYGCVTSGDPEVALVYVNKCTANHGLEFLTISDTGINGSFKLSNGTIYDTFTLNNGSSGGGGTTYPLSVQRAGTGTGTVTGGAINCGGTCTAEVNSGTQVTLVATPATGSTFTGWSGACTGIGSCTVSGNAASNVTATFTSAGSGSFLLTVNRTGTGSGTVLGTGINCGTTCTTSVNAGATLILVASPSTGSAFAGWSGACSGTQSCAISFSSAVSVTATFNTSGSGGGSQTLDQILELSHWKLTLPIGSGGPTEIKQPALATYTIDPYYKLSPAGDAAVFRAGVNGVTTSGSSYPRSELREMTSDGLTNAAWSSGSGTHTLFIDQAVTSLPQKKPWMVVGQVHDSGDDVIVIKVRTDSSSATASDPRKIVVDVGGTIGAVLEPNYVLGTRFTVKFVVSTNQTKIYYNGATTPSYTLNQSYSGAYFKVGAYPQSNCGTESISGSACSDAINSNYGEVKVFQARVTHQ